MAGADRGQIEAVDVLTGIRRSTLSVLPFPDALVVDSRHHRLYVASEARELTGIPIGNGAVTVFSTPTRAVLAGPPQAPLATSDACTGAAVTLSTILPFYLALDRHQYQPARGCLDPVSQSKVSAY